MPVSQPPRKKTKTKPPTQPPRPPTPRWSRTRSGIAKGLALFVGGVGFASAAMALLPRMTVEASSGPFDPSSDSPIAFTIANTSVIPLRDVQPMLGLCNLSFGPLPPHEQQSCTEGPLGSRLVRPQWRVSQLGMDEKHTIAIEEMFSGKVSYADISIIVSYEPWFLPWRREKEFRFVTRKLSDGKMYWFPRPLS